MAITVGKKFDDQPVGAGLHGRAKWFFGTLAAATPLVINFGKYKLKDINHVMISFGVGDNGSSDTFIGEPDTTIAINAAGETLTLTDATGGEVAIQVVGDWDYKSPN